MESGKESGVDGQRFAIGGRVVDADDPQLAGPAGSGLRGAGPAALPVRGRRRRDVRRLPSPLPDQAHARDRGPAPPACPSYEPGPAMSGLGELVGEAVVQLDPARWNCTWTSRGRVCPGGLG